MRKSPPKRDRLPRHLQPIADFLRRLGAEIVETRVQRKILISWEIAGRRFQAYFAAAAPKLADLAIYAAKECDRVRTLIGTLPARAAA